MYKSERHFVTDLPWRTYGMPRALELFGSLKRLASEPVKIFINRNIVCF